MAAIIGMVCLHVWQYCWPYWISHCSNKKTAPSRKRANSRGGGSKVGNVGQTMIREKMSQPCLFKK